MLLQAAIDSAIAVGSTWCDGDTITINGVVITYIPRRDAKGNPIPPSLNEGLPSLAGWRIVNK
jgi:hypothetical protein